MTSTETASKPELWKDTHFEPEAEPKQEGGEKQSTLIEELDARRFDFANEPPEPFTLYRLGDAKISTPGNLIQIAAQVKAGKSAFVGAMLASAINPEADPENCLNVRAENPDGKSVLHFDTEQSRFDHYRFVRRALTRAGLSEAPKSLRSYCLTDVSIADRRSMLEIELERAAPVHSVILDGIGDLVADPNSPEEAFGCIAWLHALAIKHDCSIVNVLHENPGSEKTRGHLGSQLERKAETCLRLEKKDETTTVWSERSRNANIPKSKGTAFVYSAEAGMHVLTQSANDARKRAAEDEMIAFAASCFEGSKSLSWSDLRSRIMSIGCVKPDAAKKRIERMSEAGIIRKNLIHNYELAL